MKTEIKTPIEVLSEAMQLYANQFKVGEEVAEKIAWESYKKAATEFIKTANKDHDEEYFIFTEETEYNYLFLPWFSRYKEDHPELFGNTKQPNPLELNMRTDRPGELYEGEK